MLRDQGRVVCCPTAVLVVEWGGKGRAVVGGG